MGSFGGKQSAVSRRAGLVALLGVSALVLSACGSSGPSRSTALCAPAYVLEETQRVTVFEPASSRAPEDIVYRGTVEAVEAICSGSIQVDSFARVRVIAGPKAGKSGPPAELFVSLVQNVQTVVETRTTRFTPRFDDGGEYVEIVQYPRMRISPANMSERESPEILMGFQLSPAQLAYNRNQ